MGPRFYEGSEDESGGNKDGAEGADVESEETGHSGCTR